MHTQTYTQIQPWPPDLSLKSCSDQGGRKVYGNLCMHRHIYLCVCMRVYVFIILFFFPYPLIMLQERRLERERGTSYLYGVLIANSDYISLGVPLKVHWYLLPPPLCCLLHIWGKHRPHTHFFHSPSTLWVCCCAYHTWIVWSCPAASSQVY